MNIEKVKEFSKDLDRRFVEKAVLLAEIERERSASSVEPPNRPRFSWAYKNKYDPQTCKNTPKAARTKTSVPPVPVLTDGILGHAPRGRKRK